MLNKVSARIVSSLMLNLDSSNAYEKVFRILSEFYYNNNENDMLSDYCIGNLSLYDFDLIKSYNKLIAGIIQKNVLKKHDIETKNVYIKFDIYSEEVVCHNSYTIYRPNIEFDKESFIKDFLKEFKHVKLDFTSFGIFYSLEELTSDDKKLETINLIENTKKIASSIQDDVNSIKQILTDSIV